MRIRDEIGNLRKEVVEILRIFLSGKTGGSGGYSQRSFTQGLGKG